MDSKVQEVQNQAARLVSGATFRSHITPTLKRLHWLLISQRTTFKALRLTYKTYYDLGPRYLSQLVTHYCPTRALRSLDHLLCLHVTPVLSRLGADVYSALVLHGGINFQLFCGQTLHFCSFVYSWKRSCLNNRLLPYVRMSCSQGITHHFFHLGCVQTILFSFLICSCIICTAKALFLFSFLPIR